MELSSSLFALVMFTLMRVVDPYDYGEKAACSVLKCLAAWSSKTRQNAFSPPESDGQGVEFLHLDVHQTRITIKVHLNLQHRLLTLDSLQCPFLG